MKKLVNVLAALAAVSLVSVELAPAVTTQVTGTEITAQYEEPATNKTGTPLKDLKETIVYYRLTPTSQRVQCAVVPASSPTGGQTRTAQCLVPVLEDQEEDVTIVVTAKDLSGNESVESAPVVERIDRLAPSAPR